MARFPRRAALAAFVLLSGVVQAAGPGESLFRHGVSPSGAPVRAVREAGAAVTGQDAACVSCHRRSGLGSIEGKITIPPIAGAYLYAPADRSLEELGVPYVDTERLQHTPYTDETLARAIRQGVASDGRTLNYLMPRYELDDASMAALIAYLKGLPARAAPGVSSSVLHFATIVTPDADPAKRVGMLAVLNQYFTDKNAVAVRTKAPTLYSSHRMMFRVERRWQLHVWELTGAPSGWEEQLRRYLAREPVFAVISGLGGSNWQPVQHFCESQALPCLFPNVEAPPGSDDDFYSVYLSRGVLLEAQLIAAQLEEAHVSGRRVVQVFRAGDVGAAAAHELEAARAGSGAKFVSREIPAHAPPAEVATMLRGVGATDALVLWLRADDLRALAAARPPSESVWISGEMGGLEQAPLPSSWRAATRIAYPADLPAQRVVRVDYALGWFRIRKIPVSDLKVQADTYLACGLLSETLNHMVDAFVRDYLLERIEMMLDHRALTGYYPRLTLAPGQRFASKGGYVVRLVAGQGDKVAPVTEWLTPQAPALTASLSP